MPSNIKQYPNLSFTPNNTESGPLEYTFVACSKVFLSIILMLSLLHPEARIPNNFARPAAVPWPLPAGSSADLKSIELTSFSWKGSGINAFKKCFVFRDFFKLINSWLRKKLGINFIKSIGGLIESNLSNEVIDTHLFIWLSLRPIWKSMFNGSAISSLKYLPIDLPSTLLNNSPTNHANVTAWYPWDKPGVTNGFCFSKAFT